MSQLNGDRPILFEIVQITDKGVTEMQKIHLLAIPVAVVMLLVAFQSIEAQGPNGRPDIWADCMLYGAVVVPATFHANRGPFDELYAGGSGFKDGAPLISDSRPGNTDYEGGRWHLNVLKSGVPADKYANACSAEDLDLNDFQSTGNYFECPLLPGR